MTGRLVLYQSLATLAFLVGWIVPLVRMLFHPREMYERFGGAGKAGTAPVWLHAASLGEFEALRSLLETGTLAGRELLITTTSVSARRRAESVFPDLPVWFAPLDLWFVVGPWFRYVRPRALVLFETELWPMTLALCHQQGIPVFLVSGRLSDRRWPRTRRLAGFWRPFCEPIRIVCVQREIDRARFTALGAADDHDDPIVTGNLKYRLSASATATASAAASPAASSAARPYWIAGSVRRGEESILDAVSPLLASGVGAIIAPRHLREADHWKAECGKRGLTVRLRSELPDADADAALRVFDSEGATGDARVLLLDTQGELRSWYREALVAFVGGTLIDLGGHNLFEPAADGCAVLFGPSTSSVEDVAEVLLEEGGGFRIEDGASLERVLRELFSAPDRLEMGRRAARHAAVRLAGARERTRTILHRSAPAIFQ